ncbi:MAG: hypothetical protein S4CHLAM37_03990 [Chlamydiia bacterium]|nr:hypothetical protein [Chlamydiia bacterium]
MSSIASDILWKRSPSQVLQELPAQEFSLHPQLFRSAAKDLRSESISLGFTRIPLANFYSTVRVTAQIATAAISIAACIYVGLYAPTYLIASILGSAVVGYKLNPLFFDPLSYSEQKSILRVSNLNKILAKENSLKKLTQSEFRTRFFKPLGISSTLRISAQTTLAKDQTICFLIPLLARFEFWKEQIEETEKAISIIDEKYRKNTYRLVESDKIVLDQEMNENLKNTQTREKKKLIRLKDLYETRATEELRGKINNSKELISDLLYQIKLSPKESAQLERENLLAYYRMEHIEEDDLIIAKTNGKLLSAARAAFLLYILRNPNSKKTISDCGNFIIKSQAHRDAIPLQSSQAYFRRKDTGDYVSKKFFLENIGNIEEITKKAFE